MIITRIRGIIIAIALVVALTETGLYGATITVDPNGLRDFTSIQAAIDSSRNFDTVIVYPGIYYENIDFHGRAITVQSVDPNDLDTVSNTIIDGNDVSNVVTFKNGETSYSVLLGISLTNGKNYGVYCLNTNCRPKIKRCIIYENKYHGIYGGAPTVLDSFIINNKNDGIYSSGEICGCTVSENGDVGIICNGETNITDTVVSNNVDYGILCTTLDPVTITNSIISANKDDGIYCSSGTTIIRNCTILRNTGCGVLCSSSAASVVNCIITWNLEYGFGGTATSNLESQYNNLFSNYDGDYDPDIVPSETDIHEYPWFTVNGYRDVTGVWIEGDYHLLSTFGRWDPILEAWVTDPIDSPCIDRGDPNMLYGDELYPHGNRINLGAYGGTDEASMSYSDEPMCIEYPSMDFNHDCKVDQADLDIFMEHRLECNLDDPNACPSE